MKYLYLLMIIQLLLFQAEKSIALPTQKASLQPCLRCHANQSYSFHNELLDTEEKRLMNPFFILDSIALSMGVHNQFECTDCHSGEYEKYPHNAMLKLEPLATCLDCHGGDESFASYQFEKIEQEFKKSIHYQVYGDNFTCSKCHNQHYYSPTARNSTHVLKIVDYGNKMCLSCHNEMKKYQMVSGHKNPQLKQIHEWLPNQELHFKNVRCIECHTEVADSLMVSHNILSKDKAVRKCVECHSTNSRIKASLYKYNNLQKRSKNGTVATLLSNESYAIGTHDTPFLKLLSIIIFLATLGAIVLHIIFRIIKK